MNLWEYWVNTLNGRVVTVERWQLKSFLADSKKIRITRKIGHIVSALLYDEEGRIIASIDYFIHV